MKTHSELTPYEVVEAVETLRRAGFMVVSPQSAEWRQFKLYSADESAEFLSVSTNYIKRHLAEFPGVLRIPGGQLRIPAGDLRKAMARWRIHRPKDAESEAA